MAATHYEVEQDDSTALTKTYEHRGEELEAAGKGKVVIGLPDGEHVIYGSRYLSKGIGYFIEDGLVLIRHHEGNKTLRAYGSWLWVEGDDYRQPRGMVF